MSVSQGNGCLGLGLPHPDSIFDKPFLMVSTLLISVVVSGSHPTELHDCCFLPKPLLK
jgi:hypothetical protein